MITQMLFRALDKKAIWIVAILVAVAVLVPVGNLLIPAGQFGHVPTYVVTLFGKYLCYAILALSLDLVWGYCGILSLGHGAFFALGGYAMGMYLMRQIGARGVYANPILPDFMVFLNWKELPWYWMGFDMFWFACLMVVLVPGLLAFVFGWFAFRSRVTGVYLSIITQAMTFALLLAFFRNDFGFGGNNGLTDFKDILGFNVQAAEVEVVGRDFEDALVLSVGVFEGGRVDKARAQPAALEGHPAVAAVFAVFFQDIIARLPPFEIRHAGEGLLQSLEKVQHGLATGREVHLGVDVDVDAEVVTKGAVGVHRRCS